MLTHLERESKILPMVRGFVLLTCLLPVSAAAQTMDVDDFADEEARGLHLAGTAAFEGGRFEEALAHYERAYELSGRPELLFNVGVAAERLRRDERALEAFEAYLEALPDAPNRPSVESRMEVLRSAIAASSQSARRDGETPTADGGPGAGPWILTGAALAVAVTGGVLLGLGAAKKSDVESAMGVEWTNVSGDYDGAIAFSSIGVALLAVGGAALAAGIIWVIAGSSGSESSTAVSVSPLGVDVRGRF
jgi:tetratricopeptide (TPR) repeat protein